METHINYHLTDIIKKRQAKNVWLESPSLQAALDLATESMLAKKVPEGGFDDYNDIIASECDDWKDPEVKKEAINFASGMRTVYNFSKMTNDRVVLHCSGRPNRDHLALFFDIESIDAKIKAYISKEDFYSGDIMKLVGDTFSAFMSLGRENDPEGQANVDMGTTTNVS